MNQTICENFVNNSIITYIGGGTQGKIFECTLNEDQESPFLILRNGTYQSTRTIIIKLINIFYDSGIDNFNREVLNHSEIYLKSCEYFDPIAPALFGAYMYDTKNLPDFFNKFVGNGRSYVRTDSKRIGCLFMEYPCNLSLEFFVGKYPDMFIIAISYWIIQHIRLLLECGMKHGDHNLNNALVCGDSVENISVILIDFDKSQRIGEIIEDEIFERPPPVDLYTFNQAFAFFIECTGVYCIGSCHTMLRLLQIPNNIRKMFEEIEDIPKVEILRDLCIQYHNEKQSTPKRVLEPDFLSIIFRPQVNIGLGKKYIKNPKRRMRKNKTRRKKIGITKRKKSYKKQRKYE